MAKSLFIVLAVIIMFSGTFGQGYSSSMSCSSVNGEMICNKQSGPGNMAMSSSSSFSGPGGSSQNTYAGAGSPGDWQSGQQRVVNGDAGAPSTQGFSYSSSGLNPNVGTFVGSMPAAGGFGFAPTGNVFSPGFPFNFVPGYGNPPPNQDVPQATGAPSGGAGGFVYTGPGAQPAGGFAYAGGFAGGPTPGAPFNPFGFVQGVMNQFGRR